MTAKTRKIEGRRRRNIFRQECRQHNTILLNNAKMTQIHFNLKIFTASGDQCLECPVIKKRMCNSNRLDVYVRF